MFCALPTDIRHLILHFLPLPTLCNFIHLNKQCHQLCNENFWLKKIIWDLPDYAHRQPKRLSNKQWYQRLIQSGETYPTTRRLISPGAWKIYECNQQTFYIDIYETLYFIGDYSLVHGFKNSAFHQVLSGTKPNVPIKVKENVIDMYVGTPSLLLSSDGILFSTGDLNGRKTLDLIEQMSNIKQLIGHRDICNNCLLIDENHNLYWFGEHGTKKSFHKVASNVNMATFKRHGGGIYIYYVTLDGQLWIYRKDRNPPLPKLDNPMYCNEFPINEYLNERIFKSLVKTVLVTLNYMYIIDTNSKLWIYTNTDRIFKSRPLSTRPYTIKDIACIMTSTILFLDRSGKLLSLYEGHLTNENITSLTYNTHTQLLATNIISISPFGYIKSRANLQSLYPPTDI